MKKIISIGILGLSLMANAQIANKSILKNKKAVSTKNKEVVYQVFTRLFGNKNTTNKPCEL